MLCALLVLCSGLRADGGQAAAISQELIRSNDWRNIQNGLVIPDKSYADQPYVVINADGHWVVTLTTNPSHEGAAGQHVVSRISRDQGVTWEHEADIERSGPHGFESSWATPIFVPGIGEQGRIYCFYTYNGDHLTEVPNETNRVDTLGHLVFRYSDDGGRSWSRGRYRVPIRRTKVDRENAFAGLPEDDPRRETQLFWSVAKPVVKDGSVFLSFTKVGHFPGHPTHSEGWVLRSPNLLTEGDARRISWELLPASGDVGIRNPALDTEFQIQAEHVTAPMEAEGSLYMVYRNMKGVVAESISRDSGKTWSLPRPARFSDGKVIKNPRANTKVWRLKSGRYLLWFHNHGRISNLGFDGRDVAWLSAGLEKDGEILWSEPEVVLYDDNPGTRFSYPDLIEQDGRVWLTETNKSIARVHEVPKAFLEALFAQHKNRQKTREGLIWSSIEEVKAPDSPATGMTIDLEINLKTALPGVVLYRSGQSRIPGVMLTTGKEGSISLELIDSSGTRVTWTSDKGVLRPGTHQAAVVLDFQAKLIMFVVDGKLVDGGAERPIGWHRYSDLDVESLGRFEMSYLQREISEANVYSRALMVSEVVGNHASRGR
jgi:hypothetical protein